jgi:hypothetical protein
LIGLAFLAFFAVETPILVASWESRASPKKEEKEEKDDFLEGALNKAGLLSAKR